MRASGQRLGAQGTVRRQGDGPAEGDGEAAAGLLHGLLGLHVVEEVEGLHRVACVEVVVHAVGLFVRVVQVNVARADDFALQRSRFWVGLTLDQQQHDACSAVARAALQAHGCAEHR
ncbi:hypothetical protein D3C72_2190220 [compost metagenome]